MRVCLCLCVHVGVNVMLFVSLRVFRATVCEVRVLADGFFFNSCSVEDQAAHTV